MLKKLFTLLMVLVTYFSNAQLTFIENYLEGQGGIEGLEYPAEMELDSAGNMYIVGNSSYLHLFMPESAKYATFVERQNVATIPGLGNVDEIKMAPNGKFFYLVADNQVSLFAKKEENSQLVHVKTFENNTDWELGYGTFTDLAISPDGKNLYLAREDDGVQHSLKIFAIDSITGNLTLKNKIAGVQNINNIVCNNQFVYTTSRGNYENSIRVYQRTMNDNLVLVQKINAADTISQIKSMTLSADNRFLYISDRSSIMVFETQQSEGNLILKKKMLISDFYEGFWNESTLMASSDNKNIYLADFLGVMVFSRDTLTGDLTFIQSIQEDHNFTGFYNITTIKIATGGSKVYVLSKYNDSIVIFNRDKTTGILTYSSTVTNNQKKIFGLTDATDILISKNDKYLYTLAESGMNNIGFYKRNTGGKLEFEKNITWQELGPEIGAVKDFQLSPDNKNMYVSSTNMYGIRILNRDTVSGDLTFYKSYTDSGTGFSDEIISEFVIPEDAKNLYAATYNFLVNYEIDKMNPDLKYVAKLPTDGKTGNGIPGRKNIIASNDGKNIYTFSSSQDFVSGISVFSRMEVGSIHHVENLNSYQFRFMIDQPFSIVISPDDKYLYVAGTSLFCFIRNPENGKLTFNYEIKYENLNIGTIYRLNDITISADGKYLLAVANEQKIALSFYRSTTNGSLLLKQVAHFSEDNTFASGSPFSMFSGDMKNAYIVSPYDGTLGVYEAAIPLGLNPTADFCKGDTAEIMVDEGYNYLWSTGETQHFIKTTTPGEYSVQVTDNSGRKGSDKINVVFNTPVFSLIIENTLSDSINTFINSFISEGSNPFSYLWNDGSTNQYIIANNADSINTKRDYTLTITDKYGCYSSETISLIYTGLGDHLLKQDNEISIFPNPFNEYINISLQKPGYGILMVKISNADGKEVLKSYLTGAQNKKLDLSFLKPGLYILEVTDNNFIKREKILKLQ